MPGRPCKRFNAGWRNPVQPCSSLIARSSRKGNGPGLAAVMTTAPVPSVVEAVRTEKNEAAPPMWHELVTRGSVITARGPAGQPWVAATYRHQLGDYLRPALSLGLQVRRCEEPATPTDRPRPEPATEIGDWQDWPFSLMDYLPSAARAAGGRPFLVIWHFQRPAG
jgi:hypothetical protein